MRKLLLFIGLWAGKTSRIFLRLIHAPRSDVPGRIATRLNRRFIADMPKPVRVIIVTGTNGKTTVTSVVADALEAEGCRVLCNRTGYNARAGIALALIENSTWLGRPRKDVAVFEVDELSAESLFPALDPEFVVCTNLTRDSIKRNGHADYIAHIVTAGTPVSATMILNADDLICARLGREGVSRVFFGVAQQPTDTTAPGGAARDLVVCPICQTTLVWDLWRYNHIGRAHCPQCGFASPAADYEVESWDAATGTIHLSLHGEPFDCPLLNDSIVNVYNQAAAVALLLEFGLPRERVAAYFAHAKVPARRFSEVSVGDVTIVRILTKGLVGVACSRAFAHLKSMPGRKAIVLNIDEVNDARDDCENTCWIYDADSELLADPSVKQIVVGGARRYDQALRLAIAGVDPRIIMTVPGERDTADAIALNDVDLVFNLHSVHNSGVTGDYVQQRLIDRLSAVATGSGQGESCEN